MVVCRAFDARAVGAWNAGAAGGVQPRHRAIDQAALQHRGSGVHVTSGSPLDTASRWREHGQQQQLSRRRQQERRRLQREQPRYSTARSRAASLAFVLTVGAPAQGAGEGSFRCRVRCRERRRGGERQHPSGAPRTLSANHAECHSYDQQRAVHCSLKDGRPPQDVLQGAWRCWYSAQNWRVGRICAGPARCRVSGMGGGAGAASDDLASARAAAAGLLRCIEKFGLVVPSTCGNSRSR